MTVTPPRSSEACPELGAVIDSLERARSDLNQHFDRKAAGHALGAIREALQFLRQPPATASPPIDAGLSGVVEKARRIVADTIGGGDDVRECYVGGHADDHPYIQIALAAVRSATPLPVARIEEDQRERAIDAVLAWSERVGHFLGILDYGRRNAGEMVDAVVEALTTTVAVEGDERLRKALRDVLSIPALRQVLGTNHVGGCNCPICRAEALLRPPVGEGGETK